MDTKDNLLATQARLALDDHRMAAYLGVKITTWRNWKSGNRKPPAVADRLLSVLGTVEALAPALHNQFVPR
jgi:DNA-binding transcriptional regulator YiaG